MNDASSSSLDANELAAFVQQAAAFMNATLHATLNATFLIQPKPERASYTGAGARSRASTA